tara:strand:+ start:129 stop:1736 length:1608 start_codon:yes stop_codon:yes gene_type:complete
MKINSIEKYNSLRSWPFIEAKRIIDFYGGFEEFNKLKKDYIIFETGYGPSGLPHIGTFGEIVRTSMIKNAFEELVKFPTKMITFSDDMDGLRKVPENVPNQKMLEKYINMPLTSIPDPFEKYESFGHHNNERLKKFLNDYGFSYDFKSSTELYKSGKFDKIIKLILFNYKNILSIILPTLREERKKSYSPFLPICPKTKKVLQVKILEYKISSNSIVYKDEASNKLIEVSVLGGGCKLQWKVDWAMRWMALNVDYEMCGKDLTDSVTLGKLICKSLNKSSPVNLIYEMFLDENGEKISKSKGNGISIDEWLRYSTPESLSLFMFQKPKSAKKLHFDVIPKCTDEYLNFINKFYIEENIKKFDNPVWHIHSGNPPELNLKFSFNTLINLVSVCNSTDEKIIWSFINEYDKNLIPFKNSYLKNLITHAINYYKDFILPNKKYKLIEENDVIIFNDLKNTLIKLDNNLKPEEIQTYIYEVGKRHKFNNLKDFFKLIYQVLLGQEQGPRLGSFIALYGIERTVNLINKALKKEDLSEQF